MDASRHRLFIERLLIAAAIGILLLFLWTIVDLLILVFGAVVLAVLLRAIADPIARHTPLGNRMAVAVAVILIAGVIAAVGWLFGTRIGGQFADLSQRLPKAWSGIQNWLAMHGLDIGALGIGQSGGGDILRRLVHIVRTLGSAVSDIVLIVFGAVFFAGQPRLYRKGVLKLLPAESRPLAAETLDDCGRALHLWLLGQLFSMALVGALTWLGLWLIGLPSALALGLIAGLLEIVPYIGPILSAIPGMLLAILVGPSMALWALVVYVAVQQIEGNAIMPIVQRKAVSLPPALTLFAVIAAGVVFGLVGVFFAAPLLVVAYVAVKRLYVREALDTPTPIPGEKD